MQAIYNLAAKPSHIEPLREEIESVLAEECWTKQALTKMKRLDSCLRESQRLRSVMTASMLRKAQADHTFSDGFTARKDTHAFAPTEAWHRWDAMVDNPYVWDGFRHFRLREQPGH
jgi:hypothetical protein